MNQLLFKSLLIAGIAATPCVAAHASQHEVQSVLHVGQQSLGRNVKGHVADAEGPIIGATIKEKGNPQNATVTDMDGNFTLQVGEGSTLIVTYVGYKAQEVPVGKKTTLDIILSADDKALEEVVVVGYGIQKKKLVTGATVEVKGDDIQKMNNTQVLGALQSLSPGVNIAAASGQPGDSYNINIRGAGTNSSTTPLYIIDGVAGGDINSLNPADIERIDVLKDAASCAIYGARAANGVIMITTKQGKQGKVQVSYDGYVGWQNVYRMPRLLNAQQYMAMMDQMAVNSGGNVYDWSKYVDADLLEAYSNGTNKGTDWMEELRNKNAVTTSHAINVAGGNDRGKFSAGTGYQYQDGVFGGPVKSDFRRFTFRINSDYVVYRNSKGLDVVKLGENVYFQHSQKQGIKNGNQNNNTISRCLRANPLVPVRNANGDYFMYDDLANSGTEGWFNFSSYTSNPIARMVNNSDGNNHSRNFNLNTVAFMEVQPISGLTYRGQVAYKMWAGEWRSFMPEYKINDSGDNRTESQTRENMKNGWSWAVTNTLNYKFNLFGDHHFDALVGTEYSKNSHSYGDYMEGISTGLLFSDFKHSYFDNTTGRNVGTLTGYPDTDHSIMSYFGRVNYDYAERYMLSLILRADGSSNFAPGHRWGWFPSVSAGWVVSNEKFMENVKWLNFLKLRGSWGQNGNENIDAYQYLSAYTFGSLGLYSFGNAQVPTTAGAYATRLMNENLTWETSEQLDLGFDARFLNGRLGLTFDYYNKKTKDLLVSVPVSGQLGFTTQVQNAGTVENKGVELALSWHDKIGRDFQYNVGYNLAYNHNEVTRVNNNSHFIEGGNDLISGNTGFCARMEEGHPIGYFYGYKTEGVMQNWDDVKAYLQKNCGGNAANSLQGSTIKPGDLKFVDTNHDGVVNAEDKTQIGDPHPDVTMGLNLGASYKGFDFNATFYAALGQQVWRCWRKVTSGLYENFTTEIYDYWHGEGTSNKYPLLQPTNIGVNFQQLSDIFVEDASYLRLQNISLGYDFKHIWKNCPFGQLRLYVAAQNLFTITGYKGMDPENGNALNSSEPWVTGIDVGNYPSPRTYMIGLNVKF